MPPIQTGTEKGRSIKSVGQVKADDRADKDCGELHQTRRKEIYLESMLVCITRL